MPDPRTPDETRRLVDGKTFRTEEQFLQWVINAAEQLGWVRELIYHTRNSQRSTAGFPDLVLCRPPRLLWVELKLKPHNKLTAAQELWAWALKESGQEVYVWWPADMDVILEVLS